MARIGLQLYSVRDECERDLEATLAAVAGFGYEGVELVGLHGHPAAEVAAWLTELGLEACARHVALDAVDDGTLDELVTDAATLGIERHVVGWADPELVRGDPDTLADRVADAARRLEHRGLALGYHNHDAEVLPLDDGGTFVDRLLAREVFLEPDLGWTWWAGVDPVALLERARGHCPLVHVKDFAERGSRSFRPVGGGAIDYRRIVPAALEAGAEWLLVEQDEADGSTLEAAARSLAALRRML